MAKERLLGVDTVRLFAIVGVIVIHAEIYESLSHPSIESWARIFVDQLARFAVPFFFVIAGYFWGQKIRAGQAPIPLALVSVKRLLLLFLIWCLIYLLPFNIADLDQDGSSSLGALFSRNISVPFEEPGQVLAGGTRPHLWFLPALAISLCLCAMFVEHRGDWLLFLAAAGLYVVGTLGGAYANTPWGLHFANNTRDGLFFGLAFVATGYWLSKWQPQPYWGWIGLGMFIVGTLGQLLEVGFLLTMHNVFPKQDYVFSTYSTGVGAALIALGNGSWLQNPRLSQWGGLTLGVYLIHYVFVDLLEPLDVRWNSLAWEVAHVLIILALSLLSVSLLMRHPWTQRLVS
jgi:surface polysaccharide O-acyltransferase-like enzyme